MSLQLQPITGDDPEYPSALPHDHAFVKGGPCHICTGARDRDLARQAAEQVGQPTTAPVETPEQRRDRIRLEVEREAAWSSFERAFRLNVSGAQMQCACGHVFYNLGNGWSWNESEVAHVERLRSEGDATALDYAVEAIEFDGATYVSDCECWHERALKICRYLKVFDRQVAQFLSLEKRRLELAAANAPVVQ